MKRNKNMLVLICGVPGSGKSTLAMKVKSRLEKMGSNLVVHRETDEYFVNAVTKEYHFDPSMLGEYHRLCQKAVAIDLLEGRDCILTNTNLRQWERKPYLDAVRDAGAWLTIIHLTSQYGNVHNVPEEKVREMADRWEPFTTDELEGIDHISILSQKEINRLVNS